MLLNIILLITYYHIKEQKEFTHSLIKSIICWNIWSFGLVEVLSYVNMLHVNAVIIGWGIFNIILLLLIFLDMKHNKKELHFPNVLKGIWNNKLIALIAIIVVGLAFVMVPYNWDSMTYHLPRMMHWAQNQSVAHYAANDIRHLSSPVLAEFVNVQVYLLSGKRDIFFNLLQAVSYLADAWFVYRITVKIGAFRKYANLSTLLFMTMPIAFSEALNTQVDLFASLWLLIFVYYYIDLFEMDKLVVSKDTLEKCLMMGACVSLGFLAKPSVNVGMAVLLVGLFFRCIRRHDTWQPIVKVVVCVLPVVFLPLIPEWIRNYHTFSALGDASAGARQLVATYAPNYVLVNLIKNFAHNWPSIYLYDSAEWMAKIVMIIAAILKVDLNAASISEDGRAYVMKQPPVYGHDTATNPVVVILATLCFVWCILRSRKLRSAGNRYTIYSMVVFLIFCAVVRWEPYVTRYMVAYLALLCPMIGYQVQIISNESKIECLKRAVVPIVYFLCLTELFSLTRYHQERWHEDASRRPIGYFANNKAIRLEYEEVFLWLNEKGYSTLGIKVGVMNYEYPMWVMLDNPNKRIENILVQNNSKKYEDMTYIPECIIMDIEAEDSEIITVHGQLYKRESEFIDNEHLAIYVKG